jgi:hypothetical protein
VAHRAEEAERRRNNARADRFGNALLMGGTGIVIQGGARGNPSLAAIAFPGRRLYPTGVRRRGAGLAFFSLLAFFLALPSRGVAEPDRRFSLAIYPSYYFGALDSTYAHAFIPGPIAALPGSGASQVLALQGSPEAGLAVGLGCRVNEFLAVRLTVGRAAVGIKGENPDYSFLIKYASRQPPVYELREYTYDGSRSWVPTSGKLKTLSAVIGLEFGHDVSRLIRAEGTLGAGLYRVWGDFAPLGFTTAWLGGHSVLMMENYLLFLKIPAGWKPGLDLGAELALSVGGGVVLSLRGGYRFVGAMTVVPVLDRVLYYSSLNPAIPDDVSEVAAALSLGPLRLSPSAFRLGLGLSIGF